MHNLNTEHLDFNLEGEVGVLLLNQPEKMNALSDSMMAGISDLITESALHGTMRCLVISGAGRNFCAGADLSHNSDPTKTLEQKKLAHDITFNLNRMILAISHAPYPVIAALNGTAAGAGAGIALAADFLIASTSSKLLMSFSKMALGLDAGISWFLSNTLGVKRATMLTLLGEEMDARYLLEVGLAHSITKDSELIVDAVQLAQTLASGPTSAFAAQKMLLRRGASSTLAEALELEAYTQGTLAKSRDAKEALQAFRNKRPSRFTGS